MKIGRSAARAFLIVLCISSFRPATGDSLIKARFGRLGATGNVDHRLAGGVPYSTQVAGGKPKETDHLLILTLLFQETAAWTPVETMPKLEKADLDRIENRLRDAYRESKISNKMESVGCSFIDRLFDPEYETERFFHRFDVDADGIDDIIYSGSALCAEGDVTLLWFGRKYGFEIRQDYLWGIRALRILPGDPARVGSVAIGCCDALDDRYSIGTLNNPSYSGDRDHLSERTVVKDMTLPGILFGQIRFGVSGKELVLRSSPETDDRYEEGRGEYMGNAVFGNILSKYLPGCGGVVVGSNKKGESELWYFVLLDSCERFRTHSPFEVSAGWVRASEIELLK